MADVKVELNKMPDGRCECGHPFFVTKTIIKRIPGLMVGGTVDQYAPLSFFACALCSLPYIPNGVIMAPNIAPAGLIIPKHETVGEA